MTVGVIGIVVDETKTTVGYGYGGEKMSRKGGELEFHHLRLFSFPDHGAGHKYSQIEYPKVSLIPVCSSLLLFRRGW